MRSRASSSRRPTACRMSRVWSLPVTALRPMRAHSNTGRGLDRSPPREKSANDPGHQHGGGRKSAPPGLRFEHEAGCPVPEIYSLTPFLQPSTPGRLCAQNGCGGAVGHVLRLNGFGRRPRAPSGKAGTHPRRPPNPWCLNAMPLAGASSEPTSHRRGAPRRPGHEHPHRGPQPGQRQRRIDDLSHPVQGVEPLPPRGRPPARTGRARRREPRRRPPCRSGATRQHPGTPPPRPPRRPAEHPGSSPRR